LYNSIFNYLRKEELAADLPTVIKIMIVIAKRSLGLNDLNNVRKPKYFTKF
jgi:hypothetical protein